MADFKVHPVADLFPMLGREEFERLKRDIKKNGLIEPIVIDGDTLIDGRNRLKACRQLGIEPKTEDFYSLGFQDTPADFIWSKNVLRRHLTDDQRAVLVQKFENEVKKLAKQAMARKPESALVNSPKQEPVHTRETLADKAKVSPHKIRQAQNVEKHAPQLLPKVASGEMKLRDAEKEANAESLADKLYAKAGKRAPKAPQDYAHQVKAVLGDCLALIQRQREKVDRCAPAFR